MEKRAIFRQRWLPYLLLAPQLAITLVFFYFPAGQAVWQSFLIEDAFGISTEFVWFENYQALFAQPQYYRAMANTAVFSVSVTVLSLSLALLLAVMADRQIKGANGYKTLLIWPYAVAPAIAPCSGSSCSSPRWESWRAGSARSGSTGTRCSTGPTR